MTIPWTQPARVPGEPRHPRIAYAVLDGTGDPYTITTSALIAAQCAAEIGGRVTVL